MVTVSSERHGLSWPKVVLSCGHSEERGCAFSTMAGRRGGDESRWEPSAQKGRAAAPSSSEVLLWEWG